MISCLLLPAGDRLTADGLPAFWNAGYVAQGTGASDGRGVKRRFHRGQLGSDRGEEHELYSV